MRQNPRHDLSEPPLKLLVQHFGRTYLLHPVTYEVHLISFL